MAQPIGTVHCLLFCFSATTHESGVIQCCENKHDVVDDSAPGHFSVVCRGQNEPQNQSPHLEVCTFVSHPRTELKINYLTVRYLGCRKADWRSSASSARGNFGGRWPRWPFKTLHYFTIIEAVHIVSWQIWQNHKFSAQADHHIQYFL